MSISPAAYTKFIELAQDNRYLRFAPLALDAYWIWRSGMVRPCRLSFGVTEGGEVYELAPVETHMERLRDGSNQVRMCLIGACMVGKQAKTSIRFDAADEYGLTLHEVNDIIDGFDNNPERPTASGDPTAVNFGRAVHAIVFADPEVASLFAADVAAAAIADAARAELEAAAAAADGAEQELNT